MLGEKGLGEKKIIAFRLYNKGFRAKPSYLGTPE
tara:strand:- start:48 stop:149 length:102 start_codon:yes stop_codon:yes gene_type:complete